MRLYWLPSCGSSQQSSWAPQLTLLKTVEGCCGHRGRLGKSHACHWLWRTSAGRPIPDEIERDQQLRLRPEAALTPRHEIVRIRVRVDGYAAKEVHQCNFISTASGRATPKFQSRLRNI